MISKQSAAFAIMLVVCGAVLINTWVLHEAYQPPWWVWLPMLVLIFWAMWQFREPVDPKAKAFDFNPKRGLLYFLIGLLVFPVMAIIEALFSADLSLGGMVLFTLFASILAGVVGTFTEQVPL